MKPLRPLTTSSTHPRPPLPSLFSLITGETGLCSQDKGRCLFFVQAFYFRRVPSCACAGLWCIPHRRSPTERSAPLGSSTQRGRRQEDLQRRGEVFSFPLNHWWTLSTIECLSLSFSSTQIWALCNQLTELFNLNKAVLMWAFPKFSSN